MARETLRPKTKGLEEAEATTQLSQREGRALGTEGDKAYEEQTDRAGKSGGVGRLEGGTRASRPGRARTHVLPPAGSARLSSCRRLAGAALGPHAWSARLTPGAPSLWRRSPRATAAPCQPLRPLRPNLGRQDLPHRLLRCRSASEPGQASSASSGSADAGGGGEEDGVRRGTRAFGTSTLSCVEQRPCRLAGSSTKPGRFACGTLDTGQGLDVKWQIPKSDPTCFTEQEQKSCLSRVTQKELGRESEEIFCH